MALKRKPPRGNIRRVAPIANNLRYAITSKAGETIQCESFQERKLSLQFDRDPTVQEYRSQPERFAWTDADGHSRTYTPDFIVWRITGEIEIHEVTLTERRDRLSTQERERTARDICEQRGWRYIVHTEKTLPAATEEANLLALYRYRPTIYHNSDVEAYVSAKLGNGDEIDLRDLVADVAQRLSLPKPSVISAICHLLWKQVIETDLEQTLLFVNAALAAHIRVHLKEEGETK
jgi:hypothetical protein